MEAALPDEEQGPVDCVLTQAGSAHNVQCKTAYRCHGGLRTDVCRSCRGRKVAYRRGDFGSIHHDIMLYHVTIMLYHT